MEFRLYQTLAVLSSIALTAFVVELIRRRRLKDELWLPWLLVAIAPLVTGVWIAPWANLARWLGIAYAPALLLIFSALMLSNLKLPKLKARKNKALNVFQFSNVAAAYVLGPLMLFPEYLFVLAVTYLVGGLVVGLLTSPDDDNSAHGHGEDGEDEEAHEQLA